LLLAGALRPARAVSPGLRRIAGTACLLVLLVQAASLAGLVFRPETMQPARAAARQAALLLGDKAMAPPKQGAALIPRGNDGVGIVGAFGIEAPATLPLLVIGPAEAPDSIRRRATDLARVVVVALAQDQDSRRAVPSMRAAFDHPCWRKSAEGFNVEAFDRICDTE
jgi:hypothetical protein